MHELELRGLLESGERGDELRRRLADCGGRLLGRSADELPPRLRELGDLNPAPLLTTTAPAEAFEVPAIAVVGTRRATAGGLEIAHDLGAFLARAGVAVVSGLARGIDAAAHRGVVDEAGVGLAVLGSGLDVIYPRRHAGLARDLEAAGGGLVSEYAPGAPPLPWRFPRRNRLLAALADAVVVVEAHATGGALITVRHATELGRDVLAVPGSPLSPASAGTNALIVDGARPLTQFGDVLEWLGAERSSPLPFYSEGTATDPVARQVHDLLGAEPVAIQTLVRLARRDASEVARAVARLELAGLAVTERGGVRRC